MGDELNAKNKNKELVLGIVELIEENRNLKEEIQIMKVKSGLTTVTGEAPTIASSEERLIRTFKPLLFNEIVGNYDSYHVRETYKKAFENKTKFNDWLKKLSNEALSYSYRETILNDVTWNEIKDFFRDQFKTNFDLAMERFEREEEAKKAEEEAKEEKGDTDGGKEVKPEEEGVIPF